jgi:4-hydroxy-tetrahydrodipicolinate synthase
MNSDACVFSQAAKAMMRTLGLRVGECRLPLGAAPAGTEERAREVYANLHA